VDTADEGVQLGWLDGSRYDVWLGVLLISRRLGSGLQCPNAPLDRGVVGGLGRLGDGGARRVEVHVGEAGNALSSSGAQIDACPVVFSSPQNR